MADVKLGIVFGGASEEHPVSLKSAREVAAHLDPHRYEPFWIGVTRAGAWLLCDGPEPGWEHTGRPVVLAPDATIHGLLVPVDDGRHTRIRLDAVLPVLHGTGGEDGTVQGLLELSGIPYVGCDVASSALCIDKSLAYVVARQAGIATPEFRILEQGEHPDPASLDYPVFVKPARSGSSFGVSKVTHADELAAAIREARRFDAKVLIEQAVVGSEVGCAILGYSPELIVGEVDRVALSHGFFRIHQEHAPETGSENSTFVVPADVPATTRARVQQTAKAIYRALGCGGLARVDMFLTPEGDVVLNEVNTLPGLTSYSRYPRMMAAAGMPLGEVLGRLVSSAIERSR